MTSHKDWHFAGIGRVQPGNFNEWTEWANWATDGSFLMIKHHNMRNLHHIVTFPRTLTLDPTLVTRIETDWLDGGLIELWRPATDPTMCVLVGDALLDLEVPSRG